MVCELKNQLQGTSCELVRGPGRGSASIVRNRIFVNVKEFAQSPASSILIYFTGVTRITLARQSRRFWQAVGFKSFVMHSETAVK